MPAPRLRYSKRGYLDRRKHTISKETHIKYHMKSNFSPHARLKLVVDGEETEYAFDDGRNERDLLDLEGLQVIPASSFSVNSSSISGDIIRVTADNKVYGLYRVYDLRNKIEITNLPFSGGFEKVDSYLLPSGPRPLTKDDLSIAIHANRINNKANANWRRFEGLLS
jgi:hypothetical protein